MDIVAFNSSGVSIGKKLQYFSKIGPTGWIWVTTGRSTSRQKIYLECGSGNSIADSATVFTGQGIIRFPDLSVAAGSFTDLCGIGNMSDIGGVTRGDYTQPGGFPGISGFSLSKYGQFADATDLSFGDGAGNDVAFSLLAYILMADVTANGYAFSKAQTSNYEYYLQAYYSSIGAEMLCLGPAGSPKVGRKGPNGALNNTWFMLTGTYSGGKNNGSCKLFNGSTQIDNANTGSGTYVGMSNKDSPLRLGVYSNGSYTGITKQSISLVFRDVDLSATTGLIKSWSDWLTSPASQIVSVRDISYGSGFFIV
jgi:hypothetical protein